MLEKHDMENCVSSQIWWFIKRHMAEGNRTSRHLRDWWLNPLPRQPTPHFKDLTLSRWTSGTGKEKKNDHMKDSRFGEFNFGGADEVLNHFSKR